LASCEDSIAGSPPESLLAAGFWNYLREDITFSLFEGCPLKMDVAVAAAPSLTSGQHQLHSISLILGQIINKAFSYQISGFEWQRLVFMVQTWLDELPLNVKPFSKSQSVTSSTAGELPYFWFLQDSHGKLSPTFTSTTRDCGDGINIADTDNNTSICATICSHLTHYTCCICTAESAVNTAESV
jgi:hypothetical protein